jgi:hypothetical protein
MPLGWRSICLPHINKWNSEFENTVGPGTVGPRTRSGRRVRDAEAASSRAVSTFQLRSRRGASPKTSIKLGCGCGPSILLLESLEQDDVVRRDRSGNRHAFSIRRESKVVDHAIRESGERIRPGPFNWLNDQIDATRLDEHEPASVRRPPDAPAQARRHCDGLWFRAIGQAAGDGCREAASLYRTVRALPRCASLNLPLPLLAAWPTLRTLQAWERTPSDSSSGTESALGSS